MITGLKSKFPWYHTYKNDENAIFDIDDIDDDNVNWGDAKGGTGIIQLAPPHIPNLLCHHHPKE